MKGMLAFCIVLCAACTLLFAQVQPKPLDPAVKLRPGEMVVPGQCVTQQELDLNQALRLLKRPTRGYEYGIDADDPERFDPQYLVGRWTIDGTLADSVLAPAGEFTGTETVRHEDGCNYESSMAADAAGTAFTVESTMVYDRKGILVRLERDSRGFQVLKVGPVGGDPGGYFSQFWETPSFTFKQRKVRLKGTTLFASPENYRMRLQISEDGSSFANLGTVWWRRAKEAAGGR